MKGDKLYVVRFRGQTFVLTWGGRLDMIAAERSIVMWALAGLIDEDEFDHLHDDLQTLKQAEKLEGLF